MTVTEAMEKELELTWQVHVWRYQGRKMQFNDVYEYRPLALSTGLTIEDYEN